MRLWQIWTRSRTPKYILVVSVAEVMVYPGLSQTSRMENNNNSWQLKIVKHCFKALILVCLRKSWISVWINLGELIYCENCYNCIHKSYKGARGRLKAISDIKYQYCLRRFPLIGSEILQTIILEWYVVVDSSR